MGACSVICIILALIQRTKVHEIQVIPRITSIPNINVTVNDTSCANLPPQYVKNVEKAIFIFPGCLQFHDQTDCKGESIQMHIFSTGTTDSISYWNFGNRTHSLRICPFSCIPAIGKSTTIIRNETGVAFPTTSIEMFSQPGFKGKKFDVVVNGCNHPDKSFGLVRLPESIRMPKASCVLLFYTGMYDETGDDRDCIVEKVGYNVIEFQGTAPFLEDIPTGYRPIPYVVAFSPCACLSRMNDSSYDDEPPNLPGKRFIVLYLDQNFAGDSIKIDLDFRGCKLLQKDPVLSVWEGKAGSIFVAENSCVIVYTDHNCDPNYRRRINDSIQFLSHYDLDHKIRSLRVCDQEVVKAKAGKNLLFYLIPLSTLSTLIAVALIAIQIRMRRKFRTVYKNIKEKLSEKEVQQFMEGMGLELGKVEQIRGENYPITVNESGDVESKLSSDFLVQNQPYDNQLELSLSQLKYDSSFPIGSGEFGVVFKGTLNQHENDGLPVAIKTTKPHTNAQFLRVLLKEVKVMMFVGKHQHIVSLIGCSTVGLRDGILFIVLEYCCNGSLERYIKWNRERFINFVQKGKIHNDKPLTPEPEAESRNYMKAMPVSAECNANELFNIHRLINWSIEIAIGMEHLASKRVIHGDLAARNVLLTDNLTAKISDFGLSRKMYTYTHYNKNGDDPLPWRWLALESLKNLQFSTASDVWSFGILLWEIFTLGEQPYPGVSSLTNNFIVNLEEGLRLALPQFATSDIYNIMSNCWLENPSHRHSFSQLVVTLEEARAVCNKLMPGAT